MLLYVGFLEWDNCKHDFDSFCIFFKGNKDLSRNMSSYLSLAAIENAELLAQHIQPIIDSVISGNYSLSRVLPQIYSVNRDPIKSHVMTLVSIFPNCENTEKMALLNLFALVAKDNPTVSTKVIVFFHIFFSSLHSWCRQSSWIQNNFCFWWIVDFIFDVFSSFSYWNLLFIN